MRRLLLGLSLALFASAAAAHAATTTLTIVVTGSGATSITCALPGGNAALVAPVPAGTVICPITVSPSTWTGTVVLSGTNANLFTVQTSPLALIVGSTALAAGSYSVILTTNP